MSPKEPCAPVLPEKKKLSSGRPLSNPLSTGDDTGKRLGRVLRCESVFKIFMPTQNYIKY